MAPADSFTRRPCSRRPSSIMSRKLSQWATLSRIWSSGEHGLQNFGDIFQVNIFAIEFFGRAQGEILDEEQVNLVAIGSGLFVFAQLALEKGTQALFARVQSFRRKLADLKGAEACINTVEPL